MDMLYVCKEVRFNYIELPFLNIKSTSTIDRCFPTTLKGSKASSNDGKVWLFKFIEILAENCALNGSLNVKM
jgi:hypothetical protein